MPQSRMPVRSISAVRSGSTGNDVRELQRALKEKGFDPQGTDGQFGANTRKAVIAFQRANGLEADGVVGKDTRAALFGSTPPSPPATPVDGFNPAEGQKFKARGTGYYPDSSALEGGFVDRRDQPLRTLQDFLSGKSSYVSVAMDSKAFPYGTKLRIPELTAPSSASPSSKRSTASRSSSGWSTPEAPSLARAPAASTSAPPTRRPPWSRRSTAR
jgi:hypothetical protein